MFAIIQTGGKQYKVATNDLVKIEKIDAEIGSKVEFKALMAEVDGNVTVGNPETEIKVVAEVTRQGRAPKITVFKYKPKKRERKKIGHRQPFTELKIVSIG